jgi:hypothetical protein
MASARLGIALLITTLLFATSAFALTTESPTGTVGSPVAVRITSEVAQDLSYSITPGNATGSCTACTTIEENATLAPGEYLITATDGNTSMNTTFTVVALGIAIYDPDNTTYSSQEVFMNFAATLPARIAYRIDDGNETVACEDCSTFMSGITLQNGTHTIFATATRGSTSANATVVFGIDAANVTNTTGNTTNATGNTTNGTSNATNYSLTVSSQPAGNLSINGTAYGMTPQTLSLAAGSYLVSVSKEGYVTNATTIALSGNMTLNLSLDNVTSNVTNATGNITNTTGNGTTNSTGNATNQTGNASSGNGTPRYTTGLNKLPQMVAAGEITDEELAAIIRSSSINPGVLNRLIKTGKLGNASIEAIIATQPAPPSIWRKMLGAIGFKTKAPRETLTEEYELTVEQEEKLIAAADIPTDVKEKLKTTVEKKKALPPGQAKKQAQGQGGDDEGSVAGAEQGETVAKGNDKIPPGQAKKQAGSDEGSAGDVANDAKESGSPSQGSQGKGNSGNVPPGQAKKGN